MISRSRFAPSPTGFLHLGNARTALFAWLAARQAAGAFVLRIEDTDQARSPRHYETALLDDLRWLGLTWQEGPDVGGPLGPYRQMERLDIYQGYFQQLQDQGQAYPCFCSPETLSAEREQQRRQGRAPRYSGRCRHLSSEERAHRLNAGEAATLRFRIPDAGHLDVDDLVWGTRRYALADLGDFVIQRSDGSPAFFFANALDDALMGIDLVLRGEDHLSNTPRQVLILQALGLSPPRYGHLPLLLGQDGQPLSKRHGAASLQDLRELGYLPSALRHYLARLGHHYAVDGWTDDAELVAGFDLAHVSRSPAHFDQDQLRHWQTLAIQALDDDALEQWLGSVLEARVPEAQRGAFVHAIRANIHFPADAAQWADRLFGSLPDLDVEALAVLRAPGPEFWELAVDSWAAHGEAGFRVWTQDLAARSGRKGKALFQPLRLALTGQHHGPEMASILPLLGGERVVARLQAAHTLSL